MLTVLPLVHVLLVQVRVQVLEALPRTLVQLLLLAVLVLVLRVLVRALVMLVQTLALLVLSGGGSENLAGGTKLMTNGMSTARRGLRWKLARTGRAARTLRTSRLLVVALARGPMRSRSKRTFAWRLSQCRRTLTGPGWQTP